MIDTDIQPRNANPARLDDHQTLTPEADANVPGLRVITPSDGLLSVDWREIWRFRDLLLLLTMRDINVRYKQAVFGVGWAVLQPLATMLVFWMFFGRLGGIDHRTGSTPYAVYVLAGLLPWTFFATSLTNCSTALVGSYNLITKVYFPRLIIPMSTVFACLFDLAVSMLLLAVVMVGYHLRPTGSIVGSLVALVGMVAAATGIGSALAALTVEYRDIRYVTPFVVQIWMFITPVIYPASMVPHKWQWLYSMNPMVGLVDAFRCGLLGQAIPWERLTISIAASIVLFLVGATYFRAVERRFADVI